MFNLIGWMIKISVFAAIILVLGNVIRWHGHTVSDEIKTQISHAEKSPLGSRAQEILDKSLPQQRSPARHPMTVEKISTTEQQKLKALIRELNSSRSHD